MKKFIIIGIYITLTGCNTISNQAHLFVTGYYIISQLLYYTLYQGNTDISAYLGEETCYSKINTCTIFWQNEQTVKGSARDFCTYKVK